MVERVDPMQYPVRSESRELHKFLKLTLIMWNAREDMKVEKKKTLRLIVLLIVMDSHPHFVSFTTVLT